MRPSRSSHARLRAALLAGAGAALLLGCSGTPKSAPQPAPAGARPAEPPPPPPPAPPPPPETLPLEAFLQRLHAGEDVRALAVSPSGARALTGDETGEVFLWDLSSRRQVRQMRFPSLGAQGVLSLVFLPGERRAVVGGAAGARLVDLATGKDEGPVAALEGMRVGAMRLRADGTRLLAATDDALHVLAVPALALEQSFATETGPAHDIAMTAEGAPVQAAVVAGKRGLSLVDLQIGRARIHMPGDAGDLGSRTCAVTPDGRGVISYDSKGGALLWDLSRTRARGGGGPTVRDAYDPAPLIGGGAPIGGGGVRMPAGSSVAVVVESQKVKLGPLGGRLREIDAGFGYGGRFELTPDGRRLVHANGPLHVVDLDSGRVEASRVPAFNVQKLAVSSDGRRVLARGAFAIDELRGAWWPSSGVARGTGALAWTSPAGPEALLVEEADRGVRLTIVDPGTGAARRRLELSSSERYVVTARFTAGGREVVVLSSGPGGGLRLERWDAASGEKRPEADLERIEGSKISEPAIAPSGDRLACSISEGAAGIAVWDGRTGKLLARLAGGAGSGWQSAFSLDGKSLATIDRDLVVRRWDASDADPARWRIAAEGPMPGAPGAARVPPLDWNDHTRVAFSPDGKLLAAGDPEGPVHLLDAATLTPVRSLAGHRAGVTDLTFTPDGRHVLSGSWDGTMRLHRTDGGGSVAMANAGREWIVFSDDGLFDSSPRGGELVNVARGLDVYAIDQLALAFNRPDVLLERAGVGSDEMRKAFAAKVERRRKRAGVGAEALASPGEGKPLPDSLRPQALPGKAPGARIASARTDGAAAHLDVRLQAGGAELRAAQLYVNGVPLFEAPGKPVSGAEAALKETVPLSPGQNVIEASAIDAAGVESLRAVVEARREGTAPADLWFLGFGVSEYADPALRLKFAAKDARDLAKAFEAQRGRGFRDVKTRILADAEVSPAAIREARAFLAQAKTDDTVVLFVAGHGAHDLTPEATYWYLTQAADPARLAETAASFESIEALLSGTAARRKLFLLDTCESGEADDDERRAVASVEGARGVLARGFAAGFAKSKTPAKGAGTGPAAAAGAGAGGARRWVRARDRLIDIDLARRTGAIVLSSSRGGEASFESDAIENGCFTEEVLRALETPAADADRDGRVSVRELERFVAEAVAKATGDAQHPTVDRDNPHAEFGFGVK